MKMSIAFPTVDSAQSTNRRGPARLLAIAAALSVMLLAGCQSYTAQTKDLGDAWRSGDLASAKSLITTKAADKGDGRDALLFRLEEGTVLRACALTAPVVATPPADAAPAAADAQAPAPLVTQSEFLKASLAAFDKAEELVNRWENEAKVKVGSETGALLTNQATLPYRGRAYDKIMMNTYKALNYMQLKEFDAARVELNRALERQRYAVEENARRIEEAQKTARDASEGKVEGQKYDTDRAQSDPKVAGPMQTAMGAADSAIVSTYSDYVNPFTVFLDGLFFMTAGYNASDSERARKSMERIAAMNPDNAYAKEDLTLAESVANGGPVPALTYIIYETGEAPFRDELRIDVPTFLVSSRLAYVGAAFPLIKMKDAFSPNLVVLAGGQNHSTQVLASMDSVIAKDYKNELPTIITKTLISTAIKAIAQYAAQKAVEDQGWAAQLAVAAAGAVYQAAVNQADLRSWMTLPKQFQYCRIPTPEDRQITLTANGLNSAFTLQPGQVNVVYVRSVTPSTPLFVSQFILL